MTPTRPERQRRRILQLADAAKAAGGVNGRMIADVLEDRLDAPLEEGDVLGWLQDVSNAGYVDLLDRRSYLPANVSIGLDRLIVRITAKGTALLAQAIAPDPLIEDPRQP